MQRSVARVRANAPAAAGVNTDEDNFLLVVIAQRIWNESHRWSLNILPTTMSIVWREEARARKRERQREVLSPSSSEFRQLNMQR